MKKSIVLVLSMLLVLVIGGSAFAKSSSVGLTVGYDRLYIADYATLEEGDVSDAVVSKGVSGYLVGILGNVYLTNNFSLAGKVSASIIPNKDLEIDWENLDDFLSSSYVEMGINLFARYDLLSMGFANVGLQVGASYAKPIMLENISFEDSTFAMFSLIAGAYADITVLEKINIYADVKVPLGLSLGDNYASHKARFEFFPFFLCDATVGVTYAITSNIDLGVECNINNTKFLTTISNILADDNDNTTIFDFVIGGKIGYRF